LGVVQKYYYVSLDFLDLGLKKKEGEEFTGGVSFDLYSQAFHKESSLLYLTCAICSIQAEDKIPDRI
jgi:hypothetical protein